MLHGERPGVDGAVGFLALLLAGGSFRFSAAVLVLWTSEQAVPCLKQKQKAVGLELVHEDVAVVAHLQGLVVCLLLRAQLVFQVV